MEQLGEVHLQSIFQKPYTTWGSYAKTTNIEKQQLLKYGKRQDANKSAT